MQGGSALVNIAFFISAFPAVIISKNYAGIPCGNQFDRVPKIVGGIPTFQNEFPWIASLKIKGQHYCVGSLIHANYVLTAAQCVFIKRLSGKEDLKVTTGEYFLDREELPVDSIDYEVEEIIIHPNYTLRGHQNDIALIKLKRNVFISPSAWPACLADYDPSERNGTKSEFDNVIDEEGNEYDLEGVVAGWGSVSERNESDKDSGKLSNSLLRATLPIWKHEECLDSFKRNGFEFPLSKDTQFCAGLSKGGKDTCSGDSGSPFMIKAVDESNGINNKFEIVGITIGGRGCGRKGLPGVYLKVSKYLSWIERQLTI